MIKGFKFLQTNDTITYLDVGNARFHVGQPDPPFGLSRRHWNILPQDLRGTTLHEIDCYIRGWEDASRNIGDSPYHDRERTILWNRGFTAYQVRVPNPPPREVAVVSASDHDFRIWRSETFSWDSINLITNSYFSFTYDNRTTTYRAITYVNECQGLMFDDYITTRRINEILRQGNDAIMIEHVNELINEVRLHIRQR